MSIFPLPLWERVAEGRERGGFRFASLSAMIPGWRRYPLLIPVVGLVVGILSSAHFEFWAQLGVWSGAVGFISALLAWRVRTEKLRLALLLLAAFFLGAARMGDRAFRPPPDFLRTWVEDRATVSVWLEAKEYCQTDGKRSRFRAKLLGYFQGPQLHPVSADLIVKVGDATCSAAPGRRFQTWGKFSFPKGFHNPFSFDYPRYLRLQGIQATFSVKGERFLLPWGKGPGVFWGWAAGIRAHLLALLRNRLEASPARGVLEALLVGEQGGLTPEIEAAFRATGLTHLLVVSGLHLTLVFLLFFFPCYLAFSLRRTWSDGGWAKKAAWAAALGPTVLYAAVVGPGPSVVRALSFAALAGFLFWRDWKWEGFSVLLFSFGSYLACDPTALFDLSFQFSYLAVGTLFFSGKKIVAHLRNLAPCSPFWRQGPVRWIMTLGFTNLAINLFLFPWMAETFHEASAVAPLANLVFVPLFTFLVHPLSWIGALVDALSPSLGKAFFPFLAAGLARALRLLEALAAFPFASILILPLPRLFWAGYGLLAAAFGLHPGWPRRWMAAGCLLMATAIGWKAFRREDLSGILSLTMLDVGQGESLLLRLPDGRSLVVDGGGFPGSEFDIGRQVVIPELLGRGTGKLRALVLTHPDADHLKGLVSLARRWRATEFWFPASISRHPDWLALRELVAARGIPLRPLQRGDSWVEGEVGFEVLGPEAGAEQYFSDNDQSLVLRICYREVCFLLTGDLEAEGEEPLDLSSWPGTIHVLKVAHHGSRTSTSHEFLEKVRPALALVSAGLENRFHHPHPEVVKRFRERGVTLLRTDRDGQIEVRTDGHWVLFRTNSGERGSLVSSGWLLPNWWFSTRRWAFGSES